MYLERDRSSSVADYIKNTDDEEDWEQWLQEHRVELNAMTSPQFIAWLDEKMTEHDGQKIVPPAPIIAEALATNVASLLRKTIEDRILQEADADTKVAEAVRAVGLPDDGELAYRTSKWLVENPERLMGHGVVEIAQALVDTTGRSA